MVANIPVAPNVRLTSDFNIRSAVGKFLKKFYFGHITAIAKIQKTQILAYLYQVQDVG